MVLIENRGKEFCYSSSRGRENLIFHNIKKLKKTQPLNDEKITNIKFHYNPTVGISFKYRERISGSGRRDGGEGFWSTLVH